MAYDARVLGGVGVLAAIVEAGSFSGAGEALGLTQSGVSRAVSRLEGRLGIRLFHRTARVVTLDVMAGIDLGFAVKNHHWFFLAQEADLPERLLAADPDAFMDRTLAGMTGGRDVIDQAAREAYLAAFRDPAVRHAICEDYRAAVTEDLAFDQADREAGRKLPCPAMVLWPEADWRKGGPTPVEIWRRWADDVKGWATGGGHLQAEDVPDEVMAKLGPFLDRPRDRRVRDEHPQPS